MNKQSCFNCIHADRYDGHPGSMWEPPEPPDAECQNEEVDWEFIEEVWDNPLTYQGDPFEILADKCGFYSPIIFKNCEYCGKGMNSPEWSHKIWALCYDNHPVCSDECKTKMQDEFGRQMKEMSRGETW